MNLEDKVNELIDEAIPLMKVSQVLEHNEAYERGSKLLVTQGQLTQILKQYSDQLIYAKAQEEVAMYLALQEASSGKDADARKAAAKANPARQKAAEEVARLENNIEYLQSFIKQLDAGFRLMTYMVKNDG